MTIGPEPMIRMDLRSVRFGMVYTKPVLRCGFFLRKCIKSSIAWNTSANWLLWLFVKSPNLLRDAPDGVATSRLPNVNCWLLAPRRLGHSRYAPVVFDTTIWYCINSRHAVSLLTTFVLHHLHKSIKQISHLVRPRTGLGMPLKTERLLVRACQTLAGAIE